MDAVRGLQRAVLAGAQLTPEAYDAVAGVLGCEIVNASDAATQFFLNIRTSESQRALLHAAETGGGDGDAERAWRTRSSALRTVYHLGWPVTHNSLPVVIRQLGDRTVNVTNESKRILNTLRKEP